MTKEQIKKNSINMKKLELIQKIAARAARLHKKLTGDKRSAVKIALDVHQCHENGCPLDLSGLLLAPSGTFGHDVFGIQRHLDRKTGELGGSFLPRLALPETE